MMDTIFTVIERYSSLKHVSTFTLSLGCIEERGLIFVTYVGRGSQCSQVSPRTRDNHIQQTRNLGFVISVKEGMKKHLLIE